MKPHAEERLTNMNANTLSNEPESARTSGNGRPSETELSEADFLAREAEQAKAAITNTMEELKKNLGSAADLRLWAQHHPWLVVGVAAAAGFAAGSAIGSIGSDDRREEPVPQPVAGSAPPRRSAMWGSLMSPLFELAKVAIQSSVAATAAGAAASNETQSEPVGSTIPEGYGESVPF
jgi:hypothetical protein